jgi:hypothetical protein
MKKDRFKIGDIIYISNWFNNQPNNTVITARIIDRLLHSPLNWVKYAIIIDGKNKEFCVGDFKSPDVWSARIYKTSKRGIYFHKNNLIDYDKDNKH